MRPYAIIECAQRTQEWYDARRGRVTGSVAKHVARERKKGPGELEGRHDLRLSLVAEILTGRSLDDDTFVTRELERGTKLEPSAGLAYEVETSEYVRWCGFFQHHELMVGCSVDGYVGADVRGIVEIKCPKSTTHLEYVLGRTLPADHVEQVTHNLWVSGADWCDFVSYDDRFLNPKLHLFVHRVTRDQVDIKGYEAKALAFLAEVERDVQVALSVADPAAQLEASLPLIEAAGV